MIEIKQSKTADTRTCDFTKVTEEDLWEASNQHIIINKDDNETI